MARGRSVADLAQSSGCGSDLYGIILYRMTQYLEAKSGNVMLEMIVVANAEFFEPT